MIIRVLFSRVKAALGKGKIKKKPKQQAQSVVWSLGNELQKRRETGLREGCRRRSPRRGRNKEKGWKKFKKIKKQQKKRKTKKEKEERFEWVGVFFSVLGFLCLLSGAKRGAESPLVGPAGARLRAGAVRPGRDKCNSWKKSLNS